MATAADSSADVDSYRYYDIVLLGRTGMGKSTTGNKILDLENADQCDLRNFSCGRSDLLKGHVGHENIRFSTPKEDEQFDSCTTRCQLISNEKKKVRILDVPGFADSGKLKRELGVERLSVEQANLQIIRWIIRIQAAMKLNVHRVVYFLPNRGILEKADGLLQDEIGLMYHYFGEQFFNVVVLAATCTPRERYQNLGFDESDIDVSRKAFSIAFKRVTSEHIPCPPLIYISLKYDTGEKIEEKLRQAPVIKEGAISLRLTKNTCAQCSATILRNSRNEPISVVYGDSPQINYRDSKCHPAFVPRYTQLEKFLGGIAHIVTFNLISLSDPDIPFFNNHDEICPHCKSFPGFDGCCKVYMEIEKKWAKDKSTVTVDHDSNHQHEELDERFLLEVSDRHL